MTWTLFANEWRALLRDGRGLMLLVIGTLLAVAASWTAASTDARERSGREFAADSAREAWLEREPDTPHSRAHYGDYVFRPSGPLAGLDSGLQLVTGRAIRIEAHTQNDTVHNPHREASALLRFDRLEPSTVLNLLLPLLLILAGFGVVAGERESGRLRLLRIQGARPGSLLLAKSLALWSVGAGLSVLVVAAHLAFAEHAAGLAQTATFLGLHLLALWIVAVLVTCVSARCRAPGTAAGVLLSLWVCGAILLPRVAAMTAEATSPLPGRDAFEAAMHEDREQGLDGHNPRDARRQEAEQKVLDEYGVATKEELPINLDGLMMQADEEYGNEVWDRHFGELAEQLRAQSALAGTFSLLNPLQASDRVSMAVAGTDLGSHLAFLQQAETYRRTLVKKLNDEHAFGGSKTGDNRWKPEPEFYASFGTFTFEPPPLGEALSAHSLELASLTVWGVLLTGLLFLSARRLERGGSL